MPMNEPVPPPPTAGAGPPPAPAVPADGPEIPPGPRLSLFGFPSTPVRLRVRPRSPGNRALRAGIGAVGTLVLTPVAFIVPPHAPWGLAVLVTGGILTWRGWTTREVVETFEGSCPRCGAPLVLPPGSRLRKGRSLPCDGCGMTPLLDPGAG